MHEREDGWGLTEDGSGGGEGGSGGEGGRGVSGDAREEVVAREDPVASTAAPWRWGRLRWRRRRTTLVAPGASTSAGDGGEVGRRQIEETAAGWVERFGGQVVAGGETVFWLSQN